MSSMIQVEFENPAKEYLPGAPVRGTVRVPPEASARSGQLELVWRWRTSSNEAPDDYAENDGPEQKLLLFSGTVEANSELIQSFEFLAPREPCTHTGSLFSVSWSLKASYYGLMSSHGASGVHAFVVARSPVQTDVISGAGSESNINKSSQATMHVLKWVVILALCAGLGVVIPARILGEWIVEFLGSDGVRDK